MVGYLTIDSFGNTSMSPNRWILSSVQPQHLFTLVRLHSVPWFTLSLSVGDLTSVNGIHQWSVIRRWSIMFELDTFIRVMGHVLIAVCIEDLWDWWHSAYATSLIMPVFMRCQVSCPDSSILSDTFIHYGDLVLYILYVAMTTCDICILCLFMAIVLLCIRDCYVYIFIHMLRFIIVLYWSMSGSST